MTAALRHPSVDIPRRPGEPPKSFAEVTDRPTTLHGATDGAKQRAAYIRDGLVKPSPPPSETFPDFVVTTRFHDDNCWDRILGAQRLQQRRPSCLPTCRVGQPLETCKLLGTEDWRKIIRKEWES
jgi:hypothetical protein